MSQRDPSIPPDQEPLAGGTAANGPGGRWCPNPVCRQPLGPDERFCQVCGTAVETERSRRWLWIGGLAWLLLAAAAYALLYSSAFNVGRP